MAEIKQNKTKQLIKANAGENPETLDHSNITTGNVQWYSHTGT